MVAYPIHTRRNASFRIHSDQELGLGGDEMSQMQIEISSLLESADYMILGFHEIFRNLGKMPSRFHYLNDLPA